MALARAIMQGPRLLLADEPTGNLDPRPGAVHELFLELESARGIAFLIATHNPELARRADRIYRLVEGRARDTMEQRTPTPGWSSGRQEIRQTYSAREEKG